MKKEPSFYAVIPATVRYDNSLSSSEKLFYGEVTAMSQKEGYCWASNSYFSELYNVKNPTISMWVKSLKDKGHIIVEYERKGKEILKRCIYPIQKIETGVVRKSKGGSQKIEIPYSENRKDNNTSNNTTRDNIRVDFEKPKDSESFMIAERVATKLFKAILNWDSTHKYHNSTPSLSSWVKDIERAIRIDGRTEEQLNYIIDAVFIHSKKLNVWDGWASNVQSGKKLRDQFDTIKNQIKTNADNKPKNNGDRFFEMLRTQYD